MSILKPLVTVSDNQLGHPNFRLTLVEYGDYQCPYCAMAHPLVKRLLKEKGDMIRFVFRHFPLRTIHAEAMNAALAAEAAAQQDRFWYMHDLLFENQEHFGKTFFSTLASQLGLDADRFQRDFASDSIRNKVEADFKSGLHSGVNGTPSFFINDTKIRLSGLSYDALLHAVEAPLTNMENTHPTVLD